MSIHSRDTAHFLIHRNTIGSCTLSVRQYILWLIPRWVHLFKEGISYEDSLEFIKDWCCMRNIGHVVIHDPTGPNPLMRINYRRYPTEDLRKSYELSQ